MESVDHALSLLELLRDFGAIRLSTAARELEISVSTAHRLMAMLVYRGYADQDASRRYVPGPALGLPPVHVAGTSELRDVLWPHLRYLAESSGETANLMVLSGIDVRFLASVESERPLRVGGRQGVSLPAAQASGGKALLAELDPQDLELRFRRAAETASRRFDAEGHARLMRELALVRARGFAANFEGTEEGISAVGVAVHNSAGRAVAAISASVPQSRFRDAVEVGLVAQVLSARERCAAGLAETTAQ